MVDTKADFYTTKVLVEVVVSHQFDPKQGIQIVTGAFNFPAVKSVKVISAESNYKLWSKPEDKMTPLNLLDLPK